MSNLDTTKRQRINDQFQLRHHDQRHDQFQWSSQVVGQYLELWCIPIETPVFKPIIILLTYKKTRESEKKLGWQKDNSGEKKNWYKDFSSVQSQSCPTLCNPMDCSMRGLPVHHQLPELTQTHVHWIGDAIQPSHLQLSPSPPAFNLPSIRVFSSESVLRMRWPKYWSFSFSISRSNEYSGLISFSIDWLDLLAVQGTLKSLLQHHSSIASILVQGFGI